MLRGEEIETNFIVFGLT